MRTNLHRTLAGVGAAVTIIASLLPSMAGAMTISPPLYDYSVNKGAVLKDVIKIYNETDATITLSPEVMNFAAKEENSGTPDLYPAGVRRTGHELASWISLSSAPVTVASKQWGNVEFTVTVPKTAEPGGYFGAVLFKEAAGTGEGVGVVGGTASLIMVKVSGDVNEAFTITNFESKSSSYSHLPAEFVVRVENKGNVHQKPVGNIFISNFFGKQVAQLPVNEKSNNVLPGTARLFGASWQKQSVSGEASEFSQEWSNFAFGPYTASLVLNYGSKGQVVTAESSFWVMPWMVAFLDLLMLAVLVLLLSMALHKYNAWVVEQYKKGGMKK